MINKSLMVHVFCMLIVDCYRNTISRELKFNNKNWQKVKHGKIFTASMVDIYNYNH